MFHCETAFDGLWCVFPSGAESREEQLQPVRHEALIEGKCISLRRLHSTGPKRDSWKLLHHEFWTNRRNYNSKDRGSSRCHWSCWRERGVEGERQQIVLYGTMWAIMGQIWYQACPVLSYSAPWVIVTSTETMWERCGKSAKKKASGTEVFKRRTYFLLISSL